MGNAFAKLQQQPTVAKGFDPAALILHKPAGDILGLFTPKPKEAAGPAPTVAAPEVMPDQQAIEADKKKSLAAQLSSRGRASTILTDSNDKLGG